MNSKFKSAYIESQGRGETEKAISSALDLNSQLDEIIASIKSDGPLPPEDFMQIIGSYNTEHFVGNMKMFALEILTRCKASQNSSILDIGCGCGRLALPLSHYLNADGSYIGIDVWDEGIKWCKDNISIRHDNFIFFAVPSENNYYFVDQGTSIKNNYRLECVPDNSVDITFAISVFTHLRHADAFTYLKEIGQKLKSDGVAYLTCFIIDRYFFKYIEATGNHSLVKESMEDPECFYAYSKQDFFAGFSMGVWNAMLKESGLRAICYETGSWAEKPGSRVYQDTFIVAKIND